MNKIYSILKQLEEDNSKLGKLQILKDNASNKDLQLFFRLTFNPYIKFWIKKVPDFKTNGNPDGCVVKSMSLLESIISTRQITGNEARDYVAELLENLTKEDADVLIRVLTKDGKCGVSGDTANKIWPGLIPTFPCLLASAYDEKTVDKIFAKPGNKYVQLKSDGLRCNIVVSETGGVQIFTRSGREMDVLGRFDILGMFDSFKGKVLDGELLTINSFGKFNNRQTSNGICSKAVKGTMSQEEADMLHLVTWDIIDLADFKAYSGKKTYDDRFKEIVEKVHAIPQIANLLSIIESKIVKSKEEAWAFYQLKLEEGEEGAMLKHGAMPWEDKRSKLQVKLKSEVVCSLRVKGFKEGKGALVGNLGALLMASEDDIVKVNISGFDLKTRSEIYANLTGNPILYQVMTKTGWENRFAKPGDIDVNIDSVVDVMYNQKIQERGGTWSLFLPRFDSVRFDRTTADLFDHIK